MSATKLRVPAGYLADQTLDCFVSAWAWVLTEEHEREMFEQVFGDDGNPANMLDHKLWNRLHNDDGDPVNPDVDFVDWQANVIAARMLRLMLDRPEIIRERAEFYENRAIETFSKVAPRTRGA
jgi:hypothetical protein